MEQQAILEAIALRDAARAGRLSRKELVRRVQAEYTRGNWSPGQLAAIVGYSPGGIRPMLRRAHPPKEHPGGGMLNPACLDLILALYGTETVTQRRNLLDACISTGTSTRLIARMSGAALSTVIYRKSRMKEKK